MRHNYNNIFAKYKNFPSLNIKVVCDMLQMLWPQKIEQHWSKRVGELEGEWKAWFFFFQNLWPGLSEMRKKLKESVHKKVNIFPFVFDIWYF